MDETLNVQSGCVKNKKVEKFIFTVSFTTVNKFVDGLCIEKRHAISGGI